MAVRATEHVFVTLDLNGTYLVGSTAGSVLGVERLDGLSTVIEGATWAGYIHPLGVRVGCYVFRKTLRNTE